MLKIVDFIRSNSDWEKKLTSEPYALKIKWDGDYVLLMYNQLISDFRQEIVRECRGIILDSSENYKPVCVPLFKFANYGESYAEEIDWQTATIWDKIDGSLIKLWYHKGKWNVSTNGMIDAGKAHMSEGGGSYLDLFNEATINSDLDWNKLNPDNTYMFELVSPKRPVVIPYKTTSIYHIATRDTKTLKELDEDVGIQKPDRFSLQSLEDCLQAVKQLDTYKEGYVVVDANYRRIKIKSPLYVALHHIVGGVVITDRRALELIQSGEDQEVLTYFKEYTDVFKSVREKLGVLITTVEQELAEVQSTTHVNRKELANIVIGKTCPGCIFAMIDGKVTSVREYLMRMKTDNLEKLLI